MTMISLGIESTAHTLGIGIVDENCSVLANEMSMISNSMGIHPREAANHHAQVFPDMVKRALKKADMTMKDVDLIAFSKGPGLGPCLKTGATGARALALHNKIPLIGVNHCIAHLEIGRKTQGCDDPVMLYVSGGNTQVITYFEGRYRVFGETLDIGIGNCLDKFAREVGLEFPGGPKIERYAREGRKLLPLPYTIKGMDVTFSGTLTAALNMREKERLHDICYSLQEMCFAALVETAERAMAHVGKDEVLLAGGVARNERLREMTSIMAKERGARFFVPDAQLCVDNGAMIAWTGLLMSIKTNTKPKTKTKREGGEEDIEMGIMDSETRQNFRTDDVEVFWR